MKRILFLLLCISTTLLLGACNTAQPVDPDPDPNPNPAPETQKAGSVSLDFSIAGGVSTSKVPLLGSAASLELRQQSARSFTSTDGKMRYSTVAFDVTCPTCSASEKAQKNLSFLSVSNADSVAATAFSNFSVAGQAASDAVAGQLAQAMRPSHAMTLTNQGKTLLVMDDQASFQAYTSTDLTTFTKDKTLAKDVKLLPYGFRLLASDNAASLGRLYVSFYVPATLPKISGLKLNMVAVVDSQARDTEILAERGNGKALARASKNKAKLTVLGSSPTEGDERICSLALSHSSPALYLVNEAKCAPATLKTFVVDTLVDEYDGDFSAGDISLREAIAQAPAGATITFAASFKDKSVEDRTITLKSQERGGLGAITIAKDITIDASSVDFILISGTEKVKDANDEETVLGRTRLFILEQGHVIFKALTLTDAFLEGKTDIEGEIAELGAAVDIAKAASLEAFNCSFWKNYSLGEGGAIHSRGSLTVKDSVFFENKTGDYGGAIASKGVLQVENSYFLSNEAKTYGGAIDTVNGAKIRIQNSIFVDNIAALGGALAHYKGNLELYYNTIIANRTLNKAGGLYISSQAINDPENKTPVSVTLYGNIISQNFPAGLTNIFDDIYIDAAVTTPAKHFKGSYNLLGLIDNHNYFMPQEGRNQGNIFNSEAKALPYSGVDVNISVDNQSRLVEFDLSLRSDSFALNTIPVGKALCGTTIKEDALGKQRPLGGACDMGAIEAKASIKRTVNIAFSSKADSYHPVTLQGTFYIADEKSDPFAIKGDDDTFTHPEADYIYLISGTPIGVHEYTFQLKAGEGDNASCGHSDIYALELSLAFDIAKAHKLFSAKDSYAQCASGKIFATKVYRGSFSSTLNLPSE